MRNEDAFRMGEPFAPKIRLIGVHGLFSVDPTTGHESGRSAPCLVCEKPISEGFSAILDNGRDDKMHVGYCCSDHPRPVIAISVAARAAELLRARAAATQKLVDIANAGGLEVVEVYE